MRKKPFYIELEGYDSVSSCYLNVNKKFNIIDLNGQICHIRGSWKDRKNRTNLGLRIYGSKEEIQNLIDEKVFNNQFEELIK